jgi:putative SOS response-associated peptidase YedK
LSVEADKRAVPLIQWAVRDGRRIADGQPIWFAGTWDRCATPDAGEFASFTILTGPSAGQLAGYHDRAPVILEPEEWSRWLDPTQDAGDLLAAVRPERFEIREAA